MLAAFAIITSHPVAQEKRTYETRWDYFVVSTPDFLGPFRGNDPAFRGPVPIQIAKPAIDGSRVAATLEAIVDSKGTTKVERILTSSGSASVRRIKQVVNRWRFEPARLDGQAIRVRLRIAVLNTHP